MNEKRDFQSPVSIAELAEQERTEAESAAQEIAGQLSQIVESQQSNVQVPTIIQTPKTGEATVKLVPTTKVPKEVKVARRKEMLRLFEKAAA